MARKIRPISDTETLWVLDDGVRHMIVRSEPGLVQAFTTTPDGFRLRGIQGWNPEFYPVSNDDEVRAMLDKLDREGMRPNAWDVDFFLGARQRYEDWKATQQ
jgi:hypothetical protein